MPASSRSGEEMGSDVHLLGALGAYTSPLCPYASELEQPIQYQAPRKNGNHRIHMFVLFFLNLSLRDLGISTISVIEIHLHFLPMRLYTLFFHGYECMTGTPKSLSISSIPTYY